VSAPGRLDPKRTALVVVDVQEAFRKAIPDFEEVARRTATLVEGARILSIPAIVTEQYPKGLGTTAIEVGDAPRVEKTVFSAARADGFSLDGRDQAIVCGIEAHVCVNQTVLDLLDGGVEVHLASDAVASRSDRNRDLGLKKAEAGGAVLSGVEMALFELLRGSDASEFKQVQELVK
jgi:nicotinamidase-related amidase